jgi:proteasome lid subunit RPN8/RPN11
MERWEQIGRVALPDAVRRKLTEACRTGLPCEVCGLVLGDFRPGGTLYVQDIAVVRNAADRPESAFRFAPEDWVAAYYAAASGSGSRIVGVFHSHPRGNAKPSRADLRGWDGCGTYWIVGMETAATDGEPELSAYRRDAGGRWIALPVRLEGEGPVNDG